MERSESANSDEARGAQYTVRDTGKGYLRLEWLAGARLTGSDATDTLASIAHVSAGRRLPLLADIRGVRTLEDEARTLFAGTDVVSRVAILVGSPLSCTIGNFFIGLSSAQRFSARVFSEAGAAEAWLLSESGSGG